MPDRPYATVVVPLDGSPLADRALPVAADIAARGHTGVVLVGIAQHGEDPAELGAALERRAGDLQRRGPAVLTVEVEVRSPGTGHPDLHHAAVLDELVGVVRRLPDALVCASTRGRGAITRALLGSVADGLVRRAGVPVLLVGPSTRTEWDLGADPIVLIGVDGSSAGPVATAAGGRLARVLGGRVLVVQVLEPMIPLAPGVRAEEGSPAVAEAVAVLRRAGLVAEGVVVEDADAADALLRIGAQRRVAVTAVATHGRGGLARLALGSVADRVVRHATHPVLVVRPGAAEAGPGTRAEGP